MIVRAKLTAPLYNKMLMDLQRPHPIAHERVGFAFARIGTVSPDEKFLLFTEYWPVPDKNYVFDNTVGAHINTAAIRAVMQKILDTGACAFHVHLHPGFGKPQPSGTDIAGILPLIPSFQVVGPDAPHGLMLLSSNNVLCHAWFPGSHMSVLVSKISIIGYPSISYV